MGWKVWANPLDPPGWEGPWQLVETFYASGACRLVLISALEQHGKRRWVWVDLETMERSEGRDQVSER